MDNFINVKQVLDSILKMSNLTTAQLHKNRELLMKKRWYVVLDLTVAEKQAEEIKYILMKLFNCNASWGNNPIGFTNVDYGGEKWNSVMWSREKVSPNCDVYDYNSFIIFLLSLANIKFNEKITNVSLEIQKLQKELDEKVKEIESAANIMKNKLQQNYQKQINLLLDKLRI